MSTATKFVLLLLLLAVGLSAGGYAWWAYLGPGSHSGNSFRTAKVEKGDLTATISATGTLEPVEVIDVGAQVAAQIVKFGEDKHTSSGTIDYGSKVEAGTLLAQLDDSLYQARVEQAEAAVEVARAQVNQSQANLDRAQADLGQMQAKLVQAERDWVRNQKLLPQHAVADLDYDTAKATYETARANVGVDQAAIVQARAAKVQADKTLKQAQASLNESRVNLGYTKIASPVKGVIVDRRVNVGQTVVASLNAPSLFLLAKDLTHMQVWASVNEADIGNIRKGQKVSFTVDAFPNETFTGTVNQVRLNASMTQNVVTYTVVVDTDNPADSDHPDGKLLPYLTANVQFQLEQRKDVLLVPNATLRWKPSSAQQVAPEHRDEFQKAQTRRAADKAEGGAKPAKTEKESHDKGLVWVEDGGFVRPVKVKIGLSDGAVTEITAVWDASKAKWAAWDASKARWVTVGHSDGAVTEITGGDLKDGAALVIGENHAAAGGDGSSNPFAPKLFGGRK